MPQSVRIAACFPADFRSGSHVLAIRFFLYSRIVSETIISPLFISGLRPPERPMLRRVTAPLEISHADAENAFSCPVPEHTQRYCGLLPGLERLQRRPSMVSQPPLPRTGLASDGRAITMPRNSLLFFTVSSCMLMSFGLLSTSRIVRFYLAPGIQPKQDVWLDSRWKGRAADLCCSLYISGY